MSYVCLHEDDFEWQALDHERWGGLRVKEIINPANFGSGEFVSGLAELEVGGKIPLHKTGQALTGYILAGSARLRLGARRVELDPLSVFYFPAGAPWAIEALGPERLRYFYTYACEKLDAPVRWEAASEEEAARLDIVNLPGPNLWAQSEDYERWSFGEPSKGRRMRTRYLFGEKYFSSQSEPIQKEMHVGVAELDPPIHYTLHYHTQPEIYYILGGEGVVYVEDEEFPVRRGSVLYLGKNVVHGADALGSEPLKIYYIYGCETEGQALTWTPAEDIYHWPGRI
ncbi:MAG: cupin domain-containing protein [Deltaproteobacteria bacterium]|nr:cupin domain-containing protein [Deltaproteobacteria bacterium]